MKSMVEEAVWLMEIAELIPVIREQKSPHNRCLIVYRFLHNFINAFPEKPKIDSVFFGKVFFLLSRRHGLRFPICRYYQIIGDKQYCLRLGQLECLCSPPDLPHHCLWKLNAEPGYLAPRTVLIIGDSIIVLNRFK